MDVSSVVQLVRSFNPLLQADQAILTIRMDDKSPRRAIAILGSDDARTAEEITRAASTMAVHPDMDSVADVDDEVFLQLSRFSSLEMGLYLHFEAPMDKAGRALVGLLHKSLTAIVEEKARNRSFRRDIAALMRIMTHDLKSPANAISGFVDILFEDYGSSFSQPISEILMRVRSSASRLQAILEGIYRLRQATFRDPTPTRVDLAQILQDAFDRAHQTRPEVEARLSLPPALPVLVADASKLDQAFGALFDNSFKFRTEGEPVRVTVGYANQGAHRHGLTVTDNSIGFEQRFAGVVCEPFRRLHPPNRYPGAGVGLSVVREVLEQHGGEIRLESDLNHGIRAFLLFSDLDPAST